MTKVIFIIKEEIDCFINENTEYNDNEIVNREKIDLQHEYDKLNALLFDNKLPRVPLKWSTRKTSLGHVSTLKDKYTYEREIRHLAISSFYNLSYKRFKSVLAHEMIHIKQIIDGTMENESHGWDFKKEMNRINGLGLGFNIDVYNTERHEISNHIVNKIKSLIVFILNINNKYYLNVTTPNVYNLEGELVFNLYKRLVEKGKYNKVEITVVESKNPELIKYSISRSYRNKINYYELDDELLNELLDDNIIKEIRFEENKEPVILENISSSDEWVEEIIV